MKTKITIAILAISLFAFSFKILIDKTNATVEQNNGLSVFACSKPVSKYDILGTVKIKGIVKSERGDHMINLLSEKAKKDFPSGEAIIVNSEFDKAEVIRFKD